MSSGIRHENTILVGNYSSYSIGRPWASGEGIGDPISYAPCGWAEDAGKDAVVEFRPLADVIASAVEQLRGYWPDRRAATLAFLRDNPWRAPKWDDGLDWTMAAEAAAYHVTGTQRAAEGLLEQPEFRAAWLAALAGLGA